MTGTNSGLISRLAEHEIKKVAIIDDVYDALTREYVANKSELDEFWDAFTEDEGVLKTLEDKFPGTTFESADDLSDEVLRKLWDERDGKSSLSAFCLGQPIFQERLQDIKRLNNLCEHLKSLGLDPQTYGVDQDVPKESIKIVFIDYILGSNDKAVEIAKDIYNRQETDREKPFIVLMSYMNRTEDQVEAFCEKSELLKGLFDFVSKEDLSIKQKLFIKLETWLMGWDTRHVIQRFVDQVGKSLPDVRKKFEKKIRGLSFGDYAYIQFLSLEKEEYPLGKYILWLYSSMFTNLAFEENESIKDVTKEIDDLHVKEFLPTQAISALQLAEFYKVALSEPIDRTRDLENGLPTLGFGDLFINSRGLEVYMVANAACDLIRQDNPDYNIILISGKFVLIGQPDTSEGAFCTELFGYKGQSYRIIWDHKQVHTMSHEKIKELLTKGEYLLDRRLRLSYAFQIQQAFTNHISRIGLPVQPPISEYLDVELLWVDKEGKCQHLSAPFKEGAVIFHLRNNDSQCVLTEPFLLHFWAELKRISERFEVEFSNIKIENGDLKQFVDGHEKLFHIIKQPWKLKKRHNLIGHFLTIYLNGSFQEPDKSKTPFCLNIRSTQENVEGGNNA